MMPIYSKPPRMLRHEDVMAARDAQWQARISEEAYSRPGDVVAWAPFRNDPPSDLWLYGLRRADWWIKRTLSTVVFRPYLNARRDWSRDEGGVYDYDYTRGTLILYWGSSYGIPARRRLIPWTGAAGEHFTRMLMREMISNPKIKIEKKL